MLDEQEAPEAEGQDDAVDVADVGGDDAVDLADLGGEVETADEPAVSAEELLEIPDAPEIPGRDEHIEDVLSDAADSEPAPPEGGAADAAALGEQAAAEDTASADAGGEDDTSAAAEDEPTAAEEEGAEA